MGCVGWVEKEKVHKLKSKQDKNGWDEKIFCKQIHKDEHDHFM